MSCGMCVGPLSWDPCPNGCHDGITFYTANEGIELLFILLEDVANETLSDFHAELDPASGKDGVEEATETALLMLIEQEATP